MRAIIDQIRELLHVENIKLALASSRDESAAQVFCWSGLRKLAVRARDLCFWCNIKEAMKPAGAGTDPARGFSVNMGWTPPVPFDMVVCLTARCFDRAIFEEYYYVGDSPFRLSKIFLAEVAANLQRLSPPFPYIDGLHNEDTKQLRFLEDERRHDVLWIYSVGAHIEEYHLGLSRRSSPALPSSPWSSASTGQRTQDMIAGRHLFAT
ncbi:uncharacterized protein A1O5_05060 [Cladophialophora psammophila CBS 110553]|uniref:Uncharacterized protein n=1 Tax=Cladophialophora psammophila CBS 110553 TaxID=1182543 RepID=W9XLK8_9EURO|nr:uncharacterized protein A1O5_05060 [Cladophialophora psammophila CBS 110553]EXJ71254.1 hypothetical protein A1O5_05060 [Cladophialophora psammophila CBS 110553]